MNRGLSVSEQVGKAAGAQWMRKLPRAWLPLCRSGSLPHSAVYPLTGRGQCSPPGWALSSTLYMDLLPRGT